ncbi:hypothetical protein [Oscillibacter sp.]|uniref:hypothetical protein n=1 Tax=Oscillibacter sp. TaxID=1945593 RepID=UPI0028A122FC|nr:hypothetical protein [Oscillibacter sp.]
MGIKTSLVSLTPAGETPLQSKFEDCMMYVKRLAAPVATAASALRPDEVYDILKDFQHSAKVV